MPSEGRVGKLLSYGFVVDRGNKRRVIENLKPQARRVQGRWQSRSVLSSLCPTDTPRQLLHILHLTVKMIEDWQNRSFIASHRQKTPSKRVGRVETQLGTQTPVQLTTNRRDIINIEKQGDQTPPPHTNHTGHPQPWGPTLG